MSRSRDGHTAPDPLSALGQASADAHTDPDETSEGKRRLITTTPEDKKHRFDWKPRLAVTNDIPQLEALIPLSVRALQADHYSGAQMEAALGPIFAVDRQLIRDRTYFVVEEQGAVVGCGGWSKRQSHYGGDRDRAEPDAELNPLTDSARIRAFFVHPNWARRGIGSSIMRTCEQAIVDVGFHRAEIVATLAGEPLYRSFGYTVVDRYEIPMAGDLKLPVVALIKQL